MALSGLTDSLAQLLAEGPCYDYDMVLDTESFPQRNIAGLISAITFIVLFSQEKPLRWKEINTHTHEPGTSAQYQLL